MGKAVKSGGALSPRGPWTHGPEVGFQTVEGREAAVILKPDRKYVLAQTCSHKRKQLQTEQQVGGARGGRGLQEPKEEVKKLQMFRLMWRKDEC